MACPKCKDAKAPFCGVCGSRIAGYRACPWCNAANEAENTYCIICGRKITYTPFKYSKRAKTNEARLIEVLSKNTRLDDKKIKRFVSNAEYYNHFQCPDCGEIEQVAAVKVRDLFGILSFGIIGLTLAEATIQTIENPGVEFDGVQEIFGQEMTMACLVCGNCWSNE